MSVRSEKGVADPASGKVDGLLSPQSHFLCYLLPSAVNTVPFHHQSDRSDYHIAFSQNSLWGMQLIQSPAFVVL